MHLLHVFSTFEPGGSQVRTTDLIARLPPEYEHSIVAMDGLYGCRTRVPERAMRAWLESMPIHGRRVMLRLPRAILAEKPDLVLTYNWGAIESVLGLGLRGFRKIIHHEEAFGPDEVVQQKRRRVWFRRLALRFAYALVVPSRGLVEIAKRDWRVAASRVRYIPNAIDLEHFTPGDRDAARDDLRIPTDAAVIGSVGHLRREKDHESLVRAVAKLPSTAGDPPRRVILLLVGGGTEGARLSELARSLGIDDRVIQTGVLDDPRVAYRAMDVFALPSATEQMPLALLEAMATELPCVATDVGDVAEMLGANATEQVVPARDVDALRARLETMLTRPDKARRLALANRAHAAHSADPAIMTQRYRELYEAAVRGDAPGP